MDSSWLKIIALVVIIAALVAFVQYFKDKPVSLSVEPEKTFSDVTAEDDARLRAQPQMQVTVNKETRQPVTTEPNEIQPQDNNTPNSVPAQIPPVQTETVERQFKELTLAEQVEADKLLEVAIADRKIGRLPVTGYKLMVDNCRQIIAKFPGTIYEYKAKRIMADIPERFHDRYRITPDELDYESVGIPVN